MELAEILASREVRSFTGVSKEVLVNLLWWDAENPGYDFESPQTMREIIVRHPEGIGKSGYTDYMKWEQKDGKPITAKANMPIDLLLEGLADGTIGFQYDVDRRNGKRSYKTQQSQGPIEFVIHSVGPYADVPAVYVLGGSSFVTDFDGPVLLGDLFVKSNPWPVEPLGTVPHEVTGAPLDEWEQLFYLFTGRRIPTDVGPNKQLKSNTWIWAGDIADFGAVVKFTANVGSDEQPIYTALYNSFEGSIPTGTFRLSIPHVKTTSDADGNLVEVNGQDPDEFQWATFKPGDHNWWSPGQATEPLQGVFIDKWGKRYVLTLYPLGD